MEEQLIAELRQKMQKAIEAVRVDLQTVRTGRANPQLIENYLINAYGGTQKLRLKELATITTSEARILIVSPFDITIIDEIVKGIQEANIGLNPVKEGKIIRIFIPPLTAERRAEYLRLIRTKAEGGRIMIRQIRHEAMIQLKRRKENGEIDEDSKKRIEKRIQEATDEIIAEIDRLLEIKEEELMRV